MRKSRGVIYAACIIALVYYTAFFTCKFTIAENRMPSPVHYKINEHCIMVRGQAITGSDIRVIEGSEYLLASITEPHPEDLNVYEIEMTGKSIYDGILGYPDYYACDWLVYGKVTATTDSYAECGSGSIPVFEAERVSPIMPLSVYLGLESIIFAKFPVGLIVVGLLYLWPVAMIFIVLLKNKYAISTLFDFLFNCSNRTIV